MKNSIKVAMLLNAIKNLKVNAVSGGKGSFSMKGLSFNMKEHEVILRKIGDEVKKSIHRGAVEVSIASIDIAWDFPMGWGKIENGQMEFGSEEDASMSIHLQGLYVKGKNEIFELEELSLEGIQQVQEFFMELPIEEMAKVAIL